MYHAVRRYFDTHGYLEADTPVLTASPIPESHIDLFHTQVHHPDNGASDSFLVPSPEVWLKLLLAEGAPSLYQIAPCFRNGEQMDRWHRPEFRMLEWYALGATAEENAAVMQDVLDVCVEAVRPDAPADISGRITAITMEEAFRDYAGFSLESDLREAGLTDSAAAGTADEVKKKSKNAERETSGTTAAAAQSAESDDASENALEAQAASEAEALERAAEILAARLEERGLPGGGNTAEMTAASGKSGRMCRETADDLFHRLFITLVEDALPTDTPLILTDWPALIPTLARRIPGTPWAERWELYIHGVEAANCYGEETDSNRLISYWRSESERVKRAGGIAAGAADWPEKIASAMPPCSGAAVGLDRLLALIRGDDDLKGLDLFTKHDMIRR